MSASGVREAAQSLASELEAQGAGGCSVAFVLGSGLGAFADGLSDRVVIDARTLKHLPKSAVPGHAGRIVIGELAGARVLVQEGRVHLYEGWTEHEVARAVRAFAQLGVTTLVLTNASGSMVPSWAPGTFMRIADHLNLQGCAPLLPQERRVACPYDAELGATLDRVASELEIEMRGGVYAGVRGPAYETPAEIAMLRWMGAHAVGMSTVAEASAGHAAGLRVAAVAGLTNYAAGITRAPLKHEDVVRIGSVLSNQLIRLFQRALPDLR